MNLIQPVDCDGRVVSVNQTVVSIYNWLRSRTLVEINNDRISYRSPTGSLFRTNVRDWNRWTAKETARLVK